MERRALGGTGLDVPVLGMGTWRTFDVNDAAAERVRRDIVSAALAHGMSLFDTSPMYGHAERVLGDALGAHRADALVADKVWTSDGDEADAQIERALAWYGGRIDVYQVHNLVAWRAQLAKLERLRDAGHVRVIGATHYQHAAFPELLAVMRTGRIGQVQVPYNAADHTAAREILPAAADLGIGVLVMRPLGEGALARRRVDPQALQPLRAFGVTTWAQALLKWILSDPRVHCAIPATSRVEHVVGNAAAGAPPWFDEQTRRYVARLATA